MKQKKERATVSPTEHLSRCLKNPLFSAIFKILLEKDTRIRPKDVAEVFQNYTPTMVGNYFRRLRQYGIFEKSREGKAVYYGFSDKKLKKETERYFKNLKIAA